MVPYKFKAFANVCFGYPGIASWERKRRGAESAEDQGIRSNNLCVLCDSAFTIASHQSLNGQPDARLQLFTQPCRSTSLPAARPSTNERGDAGALGPTEGNFHSRFLSRGHCGQIAAIVVESARLGGFYN